MSYSEYRGSEQFQIDKYGLAGPETYVVGGITYDRASGRPVDFSSEYTGPKNALVGELNADNGETYGVYADYLQNHNEIQDSTGNVIYKDFSQFQEGQFPDGVDPSTLSSDDIVRIQSTMGEAGATGNIYDPTYGTGIPSGGALPEGSFNITKKPEDFPSLEPQASDAVFKFGKVDKIIKKLSLRNLVYPIDADFGNTQDYMQIDQFTYRAPNQDIFFPKSDEAKKKAKTNPGTIATEGVPLGTPREEFLGLVKLPMPNSLADSNNVSWGADQLNALTAAVSSGVFGQVPRVNKLIRDAIAGGAPPVLGSELLGQIIKTSGDGFNLVKKAFNEAGAETGTILQQLKNPNSNISVLGSAVAGSALLNILQFGVSPETILARGQGVIPNNNLALLFNSPTLREFTFTWKMTPRSREEASRIRNIIRFFKQGMAPKKGVGSQSGAASYFLGTPNVFDIKFKTTRDKYGILNENDSVVRIKTCACTGTAVNYTPDGMWNAYEKGQPVSVTLSLRFSELEPIFDTDYDDNLFNYSENRPDLRPVPIDAVGY